MHCLKLHHTKLDLVPAKSLYGYEFVKADGLNKPIVSDGTVVTYYYKNKNEEHTHTWSAWKYNNDAVYNSSSDYKDGTQTRTCSACGESETKDSIMEHIAEPLHRTISIFKESEKLMFPSSRTYNS